MDYKAIKRIKHPTTSGLPGLGEGASDWMQVAPSPQDISCFIKALV